MSGKTECSHCAGEGMVPTGPLVTDFEVCEVCHGTRHVYLQKAKPKPKVVEERKKFDPLAELDAARIATTDGLRLLALAADRKLDPETRALVNGATALLEDIKHSVIATVAVVRTRGLKGE